MPKPIDPMSAKHCASKLIGIWKLASLAIEDLTTGRRSTTFGTHPRGYLVFTADGRLFGLATAERRPAPRTDKDQCSAFSSMIAYSGKYSADSKTFTTKVDVAWNENWVGTNQIRHYRLDGEKLHVTSASQPMAELDCRLGRFVLTWDRER